MRAVATLSGARRLPMLSIELTLVTLAQFVICLFSGQAARGWAGLRSLVGLIPRTPRLLARRRALGAAASGARSRGRRAAVARQRARGRAHACPRRQARRDVGRWRQGVARAIGRVRGHRMVLPADRSRRRWPPPDHRWRAAVRPVPALRPQPATHARQLHQWLEPAGRRRASRRRPRASPSSRLASTLTLFHMGLLHTLGVVGAIVVGAAGMWRVSSAFSITRSRLVCTVVYAAVPLCNQMISMGRWSALAVSAALPWSDRHRPPGRWARARSGGRRRRAHLRCRRPSAGPAGGRRWSGRRGRHCVRAGVPAGRCPGRRRAGPRHVGHRRNARRIVAA